MSAWQKERRRITMSEFFSHRRLIMKHTSMLLIAVGALLVVNGPLGVQANGKEDESKEKAELAAAAKVTIEQAIKTASEKTPGKVIEAELEKKHGKTVWEVEVLTGDGKVVEVHLDAESGAVIDVEEKGAKKEKKEKKGKSK
jgi:uncharacterized membrane protein YkoI